jgi:murein DD-endopeptidase MepM/ murein hydrolase activator NlpD
MILTSSLAPRPAGTLVYTMATGSVSFSGPMGSYGWLIIIDHPQANLYTLYGHLSPSGWRIESGTTVEKGELMRRAG